MRCRSSISSSESGWFSPTFRYALLFFILLWGGDWMIRRGEWYRYTVGSRLGDAVRVLEGCLAQRKPLLVFMGTSKMHSAIDPAVMEEAFPGRKCLNLSLNSMTFWEMMKVLELSRADGGRVELLVCEVTPFMFNANCLNLATGAPMDQELQLDLWGDLADVRNQGTWEKRFRLLKKMAFGPLKPDDFAVLMRRGRPEEIPPPVYHSDPALEKRLAERPAFTPEAAAAGHAYDFVMSHYAKICFRHVVRYCAARGITLVLVELPVKERYFRRLRRDIPRGRYAEYETLLNESGCPLIDRKTAEEYGLDDSIFVDYAHFRRAGKQRFSRKFAEVLKPYLPEKSPGGGH